MIRGSAPKEVTELVDFFIAGLVERNPEDRCAFDAMANLLIAMVQHEDDCTDAAAHRRLAQMFSDTADALEAEEAAAGIKQH
jgi:hypothetical protein